MVKKIKSEDNQTSAAPESKETKPKLTSIYDPITLKSKHGNYPPWMNRRAIIKFKRLQNDKKKGGKRRK